jgi:antirestriction protein ArdC
LDFITEGLPRRLSWPVEWHLCRYRHNVHSTGHEKWLNRKTIADATSFGTENYSKEELIAEIGASFLCGMSAIENRTINNSGAYISGWLERLKRDKRLISVVANQAQKAVDYIRGNYLNINCEGRR